MNARIENQTLVEIGRALAALEQTAQAPRSAPAPVAWAIGGLRLRRALQAAAFLLAATFAAVLPDWDALRAGGLALPAAIVAVELLLVASLFLTARFPVPARPPQDEEVIQTVSHDLRAPLAATEGYIKYLMQCESGPLNPEQMELLNTALNNLNRLEHFINDMLDAAKLEAGRMAFQLRPMDTVPLLRDAVGLFKFSAQEKGVSLTLLLPEALPAVQADEDKLRQALNNLISNALKFTERGGSVTVAASAHASAVGIRVSDTGIGIPTGELPRLFERFSRVEDGLRAKIPGTGLGLWIVKGIIEGHGGTVSVDSKAGVGTTFSLSLPARPQEER